jgi:hypothetical protein
MAYTINLTDGTIFATIADGTINTSSSMILVGKNYAGYGEFLDENFIHLLENGADIASRAPGAPLVGQLFYNKTLNTMQVFKGGSAGWKNIGGATAQAVPGPTNNTTGDIWWDTTNQQLKVWNGASWILVGPASSAGQGTSGAIVETVTDNVAVDHVVIKLYVANTIVGIISKDATFTPQVAISGFATISPGIQLSSTVSNNLFRGTSTDSQSLGGVPSTSFLRSDENDTTSGTLGILNDTGLTVGADQDAKISVTTATSSVNIQNQTQDANIAIVVNDGGAPTTALLIDGSTAQVGVLGIVNLNANGVGNIGSTTTYFNTVHAKATSAQYADVAERFAADVEMLPGTVVELGGEMEITEAVDELSENVFGVISTRAAYLMNSGAGTDSTHPPIAMTGRVPVRVTGSIRKGDRLVAAGNGIARAARANEATAFNVIGRALENKASNGDGVIEAIVTIN